MQQRIRDAEALRNDLAKQGTDVSALDRALEAMRAAANQENLKDEKTGGELRTQVIDGLKAYEFALRRAVDGKDNADVRAGNNGDVPAEFRAYVEEYYRSLARGTRADSAGRQGRPDSTARAKLAPPQVPPQAPPQAPPR
jgi:hypothetical protein